MQLLNSPQINTETIPKSLQASLLDIVNQVQIHSHFCISHPSYKPLELPPEVVSRFQNLPLNIQSKFLNQRLSTFLYGIYYNASLKVVLANDSSENDLALNQNLENNTYLGVDVAFYNRLHESNTTEGYFSSGWQVIKQETDGALAVQQGGLTLHINPEKHLQPDVPTPSIGDVVAIKMPKNLVQNGFYMAVGNAGPYKSEDIVRVYFNLTPAGAVAIMGSLTTQLNHILIPFKFKALYNPKDYGRYDSAVLYFNKNNYQAVHSVLKKVYIEHQSDFKAEVPLFTKELASGLAIAEEPKHKFAQKESFGTNRCQIIAKGLLEAWRKGDNSPSVRLAEIVQQFSLLKIELQRPYLNANSEDIYTVL
ncbi:MAG TPA: T3SS effector HopA1 family protein [Leptolyngbyaceae cyanobacterium]